jgi:NADH-quinone oxidoreductase subunit H
MKFAVFFMGEYAAMFVFSGVFATVFLGGFHPLPFDWVGLSKIVPDLSGVFNAIAQGEYWLAPLFFIGKCALGITMFIWIRATLPRLRYDQLMSLGWKSLLPLGVANFIVVAISIVVTSIVSEKYGSSTGPWAGLGAALLCGIICLILYMQIIGSKKNPMRGLEKRKVKMVDPSGPGNAEQREQEPVGANS